jgi:cellulose synthase/poly-beta-1,6-N-acetylglucosamine synthase-like glycosyltransferase
VSHLTEALLAQISRVSFPCEIICIDDASNSEFRIKNVEINSEICKYIQLEENIGRAAIRNRFCSYASYDYLLFIDCDSKLLSDDFLEAYADVLGKNPDVIIGRSVYPNEKPPVLSRLHWKYGRTCESISTQPNCKLVLKTNNFIIKKDILLEVPFDERIVTYGHEDTLMGVRLKERGYKLVLAHNPVLNSVPDKNISFMKKTDEGIKNLWFILSFVANKQSFIDEVKLLRTYYRVIHFRLMFIVYPMAFVFSRPIRFALIYGLNSIFLFNVYKLFKLVLVKNSFN